MKVRCIEEVPLAGNRVFIRLDFNVPLDPEGQVADEHRIRAALPTLRHALAQEARLVLASHLGRPRGRRVPELTLAPVARRLAELLQLPVRLAPDCIGSQVEGLAEQLGPGEILMLENLRFHPGEEENEPEFAEALAALAEVYVNEAFAVSHRAHASVSSITRFFSECAAGFLLRQELEYFARVMERPSRPLVAVLGGAKVASKLPVLREFASRVDRLVIGGALANTFLKSQGVDLGGSRTEDELLAAAAEVLEAARQRGVEVYLPVDFVVAEHLEAGQPSRVVGRDEIPAGWAAYDIGPETRKSFARAVAGAKTIVWNGPMGAFETPGFEEGTLAMAKEIGASPALSVVGGGDTDRALELAGKTNEVSYVSSGGGAFLELFGGRSLPGVEALQSCG